MPRIQEIEEPGNDPILTDVYAKEREVFGFVLNTTKIQAHRPGIMKAAKALSMAVEKSGLLPPQLLALVYLRVALRYAEAMTITGEKVTEDLFGRIRGHFSQTEIVELTAAVALENFRSKFNVALGIEAQGFCVVGKHPA